ncbi:MAG: radical SAM-associated putative lipoprotein [Bacteroidales bacterium]|nr:radical SAM-associated putative lipoprotein [Bacteroidales bacterium]
MKIKYLQLKNWLLLSVMGLFGLTACHSQKDLTKDGGKDPNGVDVSEPILMYGAPTSDLKADTVKLAERNADPMPTPKIVFEQPQPREPQVAVYGVPTVDFCVKGRVTDANGKPVKGLQVILVDSRIDPDNLPETPYWVEELSRQSDTTDAQGNFEVKGSDRPWEQMRVLVTDIDGAKNGGSFQTQLVDVQFGEPEDGNKPVSKWNLGVKNAEVAIKMKRKKK